MESVELQSAEAPGVRNLLSQVGFNCVYALPHRMSTQEFDGLRKRAIEKGSRTCDT